MKITQSCTCGATQTVDGDYESNVLKAAQEWLQAHKDHAPPRIDGSAQVDVLVVAAKP